MILKPLGSHQVNDAHFTFFEITPQKGFAGWQIKKFLINDIDTLDSLELLNSAHDSLFTSFDLRRCIGKPCPYFSEEYTHVICINSRVKLDLQLEIELLDVCPEIINVPFWNLTFKISMHSTNSYHIVKPRVEDRYGKKMVSYMLWPNPWCDE